MVMVMHAPRLVLRLLGGLLSAGRQQTLASAFARLEWMGRTRFGHVTGQYVAADARKPIA
jgi:hypothetical protein